MLTFVVNVLSLSLLNFEEHKRIIDQGFCPWLAPHPVSSCLGLPSMIYIYVLFAFYFNADVIVICENLNKLL